MSTPTRRRSTRTSRPARAFSPSPPSPDDATRDDALASSENDAPVAKTPRGRKASTTTTRKRVVKTTAKGGTTTTETTVTTNTNGSAARPPSPSPSSLLFSDENAHLEALEPESAKEATEQSDFMKSIGYILNTYPLQFLFYFLAGQSAQKVFGDDDSILLVLLVVSTLTILRLIYGLGSQYAHYSWSKFFMWTAFTFIDLAEDTFANPWFGFSCVWAAIFLVAMLSGPVLLTFGFSFFLDVAVESVPIRSYVIVANLAIISQVLCSYFTVGRHFRFNPDLTDPTLTQLWLHRVDGVLQHLDTKLPVYPGRKDVVPTQEQIQRSSHVIILGSAIVLFLTSVFMVLGLPGFAIRALVANPMYCIMWIFGVWWLDGKLDLSGNDIPDLLQGHVIAVFECVVVLVSVGVVPLALFIIGQGLAGEFMIRHVFGGGIFRRFGKRKSEWRQQDTKLEKFKTHWRGRILPFLIFCLACFIAGPKMKSCGAGLGKDTFNEDQVKFDFKIAQLSTSFGHGRSARLQHQRQTGCLKATFRVMPEVPAPYRNGMFSRENGGKDFDAFIRTSGDQPTATDSDPEARGFAIKVLGVPGQKLALNTTCPLLDQDFVLLSSDFFFTKDTEYYASLVKSFTELGIAGAVQWAFGLYTGPEPAPVFWNPLTWKPDVILNSLLIGLGSRSMNMPLDWEYSSATAYSNGGPPNAAVKFHVRPCQQTFRPEDRAMFKAKRKANPMSFLSDTMHAHLEKKEVCMEFLIQPQVDTCKQNTNDPRKVWSSPKFKVAELRIPKQKFLSETQDDACRTASFNPWHGIVQHKPLGAVNFARKLSYESAAVYRKHGGCPRQLTADEVFSGPTRPTHSGEGDLKNFKYEAYKLPEFVGLPYKAPDRGVLNLFTPYKYLRLAYSFAFEKWGKAPAKGHGRDEYESMQEYDDDLPQGKNILPRNRVMQLEGPDNVHLANEDWVTGYQAIAGINPMMITKAKYLPNATGLSEDEKIRQLPDDLNMTAVIAHLKQEGTTVAKLIAEERLFFTDFHCLEDIPNKGGTVLYKPVALYWLNSTKNDAARQLMPLAIQLTRFAAEDKRSNRLFTPRDDPDQWLWAKLHLMHADAVTHEALMHLGFTHLAAEPIVIAFNRRLAKDNHILQFMNRHFLETIDINELGRRTLLAPGGQFDQITSLGLNGTLSIMQRGYRHHSSLREDRGWSFGDYNFRNNLQLRGFDFPSYEDAGSSKDDMPGFYYRDDGALVYELIRLYVARHLQRYFEPQEACNVRPQKLWKERGGIVDDKEECDKAVRNDQSLRDLHFELGSESLADIPGEVPLFYESFDGLVEFLTTVVFHCSAQHSAVNFAQYHWYAFTPLRPLQLDAEMPIDNHDLHDLDVKYMINAMSNKKTTHAMRQTVHLITLPPQYTLKSRMFEDPLLADRHRFEINERLEDIERMINARNNKTAKAGRIPYPYLLPDHVAASISI